MPLVCTAARLREVLHPVHPLDSSSVERLVEYTRVLDRWAAGQRLVGWRRAERLLQEGIRDAWSALPLIGGLTEPIVDIGSGAGLPALILAAAWPDRTIHLVEARRKRVAFLREAVRAMGVSSVVIHHGRAQDLQTRGAFDPEGALITSRAFAKPIRVLELAARWGAGSCLVTSSKRSLPPSDPDGWIHAGRCSSRPNSDSEHVLYKRDVRRL
jgi:16S rRNA (guanine527-N7)-methyltransferase